jgi:hypothetical protein
MMITEHRLPCPNSIHIRLGCDFHIDGSDRAVGSFWLHPWPTFDTGIYLVVPEQSSLVGKPYAIFLWERVTRRGGMKIFPAPLPDGLQRPA